MYYIGVDVGGTFTDVVVLDDQGNVQLSKAETTPSDPSRGLLNGLSVAAESLGITREVLLGNASYLAHGTTVATNALLERKGAKVGLIATKGFGDTLFIQRAMGLSAGLSEEEAHRFIDRSLPVPIVPRPMVKEVTERVDYKGAVVVPLDDEEARQAIRELVQLGVEALAVCFLWSFRNPAHEERVKALAAEEAPGVSISISSELMPVIREYERTVTTVFNSFLAPTVGSYVARLEELLRGHGFTGVLSLVSSSGGVLTPGTARERPVFLMNSGPSAGVSSSLYVGNALGYKNIITTDMGGTSFDVSLIVDGRPSLVTKQVYSKYLVHVPMIDVVTLSAGGGSIAYLASGMLRVGPKSAGADPGPACYGKGGTEPTVTDADVVLGMIDPGYFLGGRIKLDKSLAEAAIEERIARPLGMDVVRAAAGIKRVADEQMATTLRTMTIKKGHDPREFVIFAYGGAGPTHCASYGAELDVESIVVPFTATVHSAFGAAGADLVHIFELSDVIRTPIMFGKASESLDCERITGNFRGLEERARGILIEERVRDEDMVFSRTLDMRYRRQTHELSIPVPGGSLSPEQIDSIVDSFEKRYEDLYGPGTAYREAGVEITVFKLEARGRIPKPALKAYDLEPPDASRAIIGEREIYFYEIEKHAAATVYDGYKVRPGHRFAGPAVLQQPGTTIVVGPGQQATVDRFLNVVLERNKEPLW